VRGQETITMRRRLRKPHQIPLVVCGCALIASCGILDPDEGDFDVDAIPGNYSAIYAALELGAGAELINPDLAFVFDLEFTADGHFSGCLTFPEPMPERFTELVWGGPPPFDAPVSGTWELREDHVHLAGANINFLNVLVFDSNGPVSINEFGVSPNGELSFGAGECLTGETNGVYQDVLVDYYLTVGLCKKGPWSSS
jgi:hypothetical protein